MSVVKSFIVSPCSRSEISTFIEENHYSRSINGSISDYCFKLMAGDTLIGAAFFGRLAMANQWRRFSDNPQDVIELRRLVCIDDTPKNTESYFIGKMLRWLSRNTKIRHIVSYADAEYGHTGIIYKATNFKYLGFRKGGKVIVYKGRRYHDKSIRTYYKGRLKPFAAMLRKALEAGEAYYKSVEGKHTYVYTFNRKI